MRTFDGFMVALAEGLAAMRNLTPASAAYKEKEREMGRNCYEAEEHLPKTELRLLRGTLGISESKWRGYKLAFINKGKSSDM
jgi:DNA-binding transcriptional regulator YiaG